MLQESFIRLSKRLMTTGGVLRPRVSSKQTAELHPRPAAVSVRPTVGWSSLGNRHSGGRLHHRSPVDSCRASLQCVSAGRAGRGANVLGRVLVSAAGRLVDGMAGLEGGFSVGSPPNLHRPKPTAAWSLSLSFCPIEKAGETVMYYYNDNAATYSELREIAFPISL